MLQMTELELDAALAPMEGHRGAGLRRESYQEASKNLSRPEMISVVGASPAASSQRSLDAPLFLFRDVRRASMWERTKRPEAAIANAALQCYFTHAYCSQSWASSMPA